MPVKPREYDVVTLADGTKVIVLEKWDATLAAANDCKQFIQPGSFNEHGISRWFPGEHDCMTIHYSAEPGKTGVTAARKNVCEEANEIAGQGGDRMRDYGHPLDNHKRIADGWSIILGHPVTPSQAALCMMWLKLAREMNTYKRDNMVDLCGYAKCYEMIKDEEKRREEVKP